MGELLDNPQHEKFAQLVASGMDAKDAYTRVYPKCKGESAEASGCRLLRNVKHRVTELQRASATATVMSMQERREFFARAKRIKLHALDLEKDGDLIQEIDYHSGEHGGGIKKLKLPGKRECVMDDAKLAGELLDKPAVNVSVAVNVLAPERQKELQRRKLLSIERRRQAMGSGN